jgi:hypothetical protein
MARGDHIKVYRSFRLYSHHGIDLGDGTVVHFAGEPFRTRRARVVRTDMADFLRGGQARVVHHRKGSLPVDDVVAMAESLLEQGNYSVFHNNCEHFATLCKTGRLKSRQVRRAAWLSAAALVSSAVFFRRRWGRGKTARRSV